MLGSMLQYQLAPAVTFTPRPDGGAEVTNGADLHFAVSALQRQLIEAFRQPRAVEELAPDEPTRAALRVMVSDLEAKLVLLEVGRSSDREMQLVWNYLSRGPVSRAIFHIDNESDSIEAFEQSGVEAVRAIEALVALEPTWKVATIGCGMGRIEKALAPRVLEIAAFDISDEMLGRAKLFLADRPNVALLLTDGTLRPLADGSIDLVATFLVFQHVTREGSERYIAEAGRVTRPGGRFLFQVHCYPSGTATPQVASPVERYYGSGKVTYGEDEVRRWLDQAGFVIDLLRPGSMEGDERRLTGTPGAWQSLLVLATRR